MPRISVDFSPWVNFWIQTWLAASHSFSGLVQTGVVLLRWLLSPASSAFLTLSIAAAFKGIGRHPIYQAGYSSKNELIKRKWRSHMILAAAKRAISIFFTFWRVNIFSRAGWRLHHEVFSATKWDMEWSKSAKWLQDDLQYQCSAHLWRIPFRCGKNDH